MSPFFVVMAVLFTAQMSAALFLMFGGRGVPWYKRAVAAFGSVGMAICLAALFFAPKESDPFKDPPFGLSSAVGLLIVNITLAVRLFNHFRSGEDSFSCLGTAGRLIGCAVVAWGVFALVTLGIVLLMGFVTMIPSVSIY